jgi:hypothetical protein
MSLVILARNDDHLEPDMDISSNTNGSSVDLCLWLGDVLSLESSCLCPLLWYGLWNWCWEVLFSIFELRSDAVFIFRLCATHNKSWWHGIIK